MNVKRGLLRAWIVGSLLWIAGVGIIGWSQLSEIFVTIEPPTDKGAVVLAPGPYACWAARHPDNPFAFMDESDPKSPAEAWRRCVAYKVQIPEYAFAPPLILLVLGYVVAWVAKGFRKE
jgi:hypothetical protein